MGMHALNHTYSSIAFLKHIILVTWQEISGGPTQGINGWSLRVSFVM